jgi:hypothetical protein
MHGLHESRFPCDTLTIVYIVDENGLIIESGMSPFGLGKECVRVYPRRINEPDEYGVLFRYCSRTHYLLRILALPVGYISPVAMVTALFYIGALYYLKNESRSNKRRSYESEQHDYQLEA